MAKKMDQPIELTTAQVAEQLGITPLAVRGLIKRGHFPNWRKLPGKTATYLILCSDLEQYLAEREARKLKKKSASSPQTG